MRRRAPDRDRPPARTRARPRHVDEGVLGLQREPHALFQDGQEQTHSIVVRPERGAARSAEAGGRDQRLYFEQQRPCALEAADDDGARRTLGPLREEEARGFATSARPRSAISKTPISLVDPNRFLTARKTRYAWWRSPSKYRTVSTRCSSTRGPASAPSLVTCPTRKVAMPSPLASSIRRAPHSRTWLTLPGADSRLGR